MNKTIKIIDLLNKIANGEEVPKKFIYEGNLYYLQKEKCYRSDEINEIFESQFIFEYLNNEVEIIEDNDKLEKIKDNDKLEKININDNGTLGFPNECWTARNMDKAFAIRINKMIDHINKIEEKLDEK